MLLMHKIKWDISFLYIYHGISFSLGCSEEYGRSIRSYLNDVQSLTWGFLLAPAHRTRQRCRAVEVVALANNFMFLSRPHFVKLLEIIYYYNNNTISAARQKLDWVQFLSRDENYISITSEQARCWVAIVLTSTALQVLPRTMCSHM